MPNEHPYYDYATVPQSDVQSSDYSDQESVDDDDFDADHDEDSGDSSDGGSLHTKKCCKTVRKKLWNFLKSFFIGYIPDNLYAIDFKLLFILTAMYTSLITQFRQAADQEADEDVDSGRLFRINSVWTNHSVSGGVSDRILWNCRSDSKTCTYYKTLYLGLIILYCIVVIVYLFASVIINSMVASAVSKLKVKIYTSDNRENNNAKGSDEIDIAYLEMVADEVKITYQVHEKLKYIKHKLFNLNKIEADKEILKNKISKLNKWYDKLLRFKRDTHFYNWFTVLYIIPRFEIIIMLFILTFTLTSYDIHPIGCLSNIRISYNEAEESVTLKISENSMFYKKACIVLIVLLAITWIFLKLFQFSLLPRSKWGLQIDKSDKSNCCYYCCCCCCPYKITTNYKPVVHRTVHA